MENGGGSRRRWGFRGNEEILSASSISVRGILGSLMKSLDPVDPRPVIPLGHGDPSAFPSYRITSQAETAVSDAVYSANFNGYAHASGLPLARQAVAEYLSKDLPYKLSEEDVYLTVGCSQAIEVILTVLARPNANILLPRPGFPYYEARAAHSNLQVRYFDLLPDHGWEVDLNSVEAMADENTVAIVIINPGNPCGNVFKYQHLKKIAETARKLGILVVADEVYGHLTFGDNPFVPMGVFGSIVPIITLGSISKRWIVPGWKLGWIVVNDTNGILKEEGVIDGIAGLVNISCDPATFIQGAIPDILLNTKSEFFSKILNVLREASDMCYERVKEIPCITCLSKPEGSMFAMVKLNLNLLEDIVDDFDFCLKLAKEESLIIFPGFGVGLKNWLRISFAIEPLSLDDGLGRLQVFCQRHAKK